jgi:endonuclease YncB( thermonuclease family)
MPVTRRRSSRRGRTTVVGLVLAAIAGLAALRGPCASPSGGGGGGGGSAGERREAPSSRPGGRSSRPEDGARAPQGGDGPGGQGGSVQKADAPGLVIGEHRLARVVDGDTVRVDGLDASLRLIGIDAEETFKHEADRRAAAADWQGYLQAKRGRGKRPVKFGSPMGEAAKAWGVRWLEGVSRVRVERDHPAEIRDRFDRYLAYVLVEKDGRWLNYNVELVRAGMSPYFRKYGSARRFHRELTQAAAEAKAARRGIWAPGAKAYPDYAEREAWWGARGDFVDEFRREAEGKPSYIDITHEDARARLADHAGREVHVLGTIDELARPSGGPARAEMAYSRDGVFPLIFPDRKLLAKAGVSAWRGEYVVVTGAPALHENERTGERQLRLVVERASQIRLSPVPGLTPPRAARDSAEDAPEPPQPQPQP